MKSCAHSKSDTVENVDPTMELLLKVLDFGSIPFHETHWWFFLFFIIAL